MDKLQIKMMLLNIFAEVTNSKELETIFIALNKLQTNELTCLILAINQLKNGDK